MHRNQEGIAKTLANPAVLIPFASLEVVYMLANGFLEEGYSIFYYYYFILLLFLIVVLLYSLS